MPVLRVTSGDRVSAGQRDKWVAIEQQPADPAGGGYPVENWTPLTSAFMSRLDVRGDERFSANQDSAQVETQWEMPFRSDMDPEVIDVAATRRLVFRGRIYNILSASAIERRRGITLITRVKA